MQVSVANSSASHIAWIDAASNVAPALIQTVWPPKLCPDSTTALTSAGPASASTSPSSASSAAATSNDRSIHSGIARGDSWVISVLPMWSGATATQPCDAACRIWNALLPPKPWLPWL